MTRHAILTEIKEHLAVTICQSRRLQSRFWARSRNGQPVRWANLLSSTANFSVARKLVHGPTLQRLLVRAGLLAKQGISVNEILSAQDTPPDMADFASACARRILLAFRYGKAINLGLVRGVNGRADAARFVRASTLYTLVKKLADGCIACLSHEQNNDALPKRLSIPFAAPLRRLLKDDGWNASEPARVPGLTPSVLTRLRDIAIEFRDHAERLWHARLADVQEVRRLAGLAPLQKPEAVDAFTVQHHGLSAKAIQLFAIIACLKAIERMRPDAAAAPARAFSSNADLIFKLASRCEDTWNSQCPDWDSEADREALAIAMWFARHVGGRAYQSDSFSPVGVFSAEGDACHAAIWRAFGPPNGHSFLVAGGLDVLFETSTAGDWARLPASTHVQWMHPSNVRLDEMA